MTIPFRTSVEDADWLHLADDEQVRWTGRPARVTLLPAFAIAGLFFVLGLAVTRSVGPVLAAREWPELLGYLPLIVSVLGVAYGLFVYLQWKRLLYVITDEEIYVKVGLISRDVTQVPLTRVQNTSYDQSILQRVLSFGDIYIYTAGTHTEDVQFRNVPHPERIKSTLTTQLSSTRTRAVQDTSV